MKRALPYIVIAVAVAVIGFLLFKPAASPTAGIRKVDAAGLVAAQKAGAQVVDVRTAGEYQLAHIPGAINVPVDQIGAAAQSWNRNGSFVVYCASGVRSAEAQKILESMGFKNVADFSGGMAAWSGPVEKGSSAGAQTVPTSGKPVFIEFFTPT